MFLLKAKLFPPVKALRFIYAFSRGSHKESPSILDKAFLQCVLFYASSGWFPFLRVTNDIKLERIRRVASLVIAGCLSFSLILLLFSSFTVHLNSFLLCHFTSGFSLSFHILSSRTGVMLSHLNSFTCMFFPYPLKNLCFLAMSSFVFATMDAISIKLFVSLELAELRILHAAPVVIGSTTLIMLFCTVQLRTLCAACILATSLCITPGSGLGSFRDFVVPWSSTEGTRTTTER